MQTSKNLKTQGKPQTKLGKNHNLTLDHNDDDDHDDNDDQTTMMQR